MDTEFKYVRIQGKELASNTLAFLVTGERRCMT